MPKFNQLGFGTAGFILFLVGACLAIIGSSVFLKNSGFLSTINKQPSESPVPVSIEPIKVFQPEKKQQITTKAILYKKSFYKTNQNGEKFGDMKVIKLILDTFKEVEVNMDNKGFSDNNFSVSHNGKLITHWNQGNIDIADSLDTRFKNIVNLGIDNTKTITKIFWSNDDSSLIYQLNSYSKDKNEISFFTIKVDGSNQKLLESIKYDKPIDLLGLSNSDYYYLTNDLVEGIKQINLHINSLQNPKDNKTVQLDSYSSRTIYHLDGIYYVQLYPDAKKDDPSYLKLKRIIQYNLTTGQKIVLYEPQNQDTLLVISIQKVDTNLSDPYLLITEKRKDSQYISYYLNPSTKILNPVINKDPYSSFIAVSSSLENRYVWLTYSKDLFSVGDNFCLLDRISGQVNDISNCDNRNSDKKPFENERIFLGWLSQ